jgi:GNAT superfamily N-acetyltransferase
MSYLRFDKASLPERELLALIRAKAWAKELSESEFIQRNQILYNHPFGKTRVETYVLRNPENKIVSSMDCLRVKFLTKEKKTGKVSTKEGFLIASVITPPQHRRKGYASLLLNLFFEKQTFELGVLYSDIGPKFYEKWGFKKTHAAVYEVETIPTKNQPTIKEIELKTWVDTVVDLRKLNFIKEERAQWVLAPDPEFWDWQLERFRYFAQLKGGGKLPGCFFEAETNHGKTYFSVVLNALTQKAEVLWRDSNCQDSLAAIGAVVRGLGLSHFSLWSAAPQGKLFHEECPMGWCKGAEEPQAEGFYDPQLCDWW